MLAGSPPAWRYWSQIQQYQMASSNFGYERNGSRGKALHTEPQTLKGGIEIQLRNYGIAPYPTNSEEKLNESPKWLRASSQYEVITAPLVNSTHYKVIYHYHNFGYDENEKRATKRADRTRARPEVNNPKGAIWSHRLTGLGHHPFTVAIWVRIPLGSP